MPLTTVDGNLLSANAVETAIDTPFSFRNKIINGSFEVNQRGTSGTITGTPVYTSDRWIAASTVNTTWGLGAGIIGGNALNWNGAASFTYGWMQQRIEAANVSMLAGSKVTVAGVIYNSVASTRTVTLGIYTPSAVDNHTTQNLVEAFSISLGASGWTYFSKTLTNVLSAEVTKGLAIQFSTTTLSAGEVLGFDFIQLEAGSIATPFEHRPYGTELALCQRYYEVCLVQAVGNGAANSSFGSHILFAVRKRASPSCTQLANNVNFTQTGVTTTTSSYVTDESGVLVYRNSNATFAHFSERFAAAIEL